MGQSPALSFAPTLSINQVTPSPGTLSTPQTASANKVTTSASCHVVAQECVNEDAARPTGTSSTGIRQISHQNSDLTRPSKGRGSNRAIVHPAPEGGGDKVGVGLSSDEARRKRQEVQKMKKEEWHRKHQMQVANQQMRSDGGKEEEEEEGEGAKSGGVSSGSATDCNDDLITDGE